jgi:cathepsin D
VVLDTGSSDFWLPSSSCQQCQSTAPKFDTSSSSSFQAPSGSNGQIKIPYGSGTVIGTLGADTVSLAGFTVPKQEFLVVDQISNSFFGGEPDVSGLMGLAFPSLAATRATPFWQALASSNQLDQSMMAFWLARADKTSSKSEQPGGEFTLGGVNTTLFSGDIEYNNQPNGQTASWWLLSMNSES